MLMPVVTATIDEQTEVESGISIEPLRRSKKNSPERPEISGTDSWLILAAHADLGRTAADAKPVSPQPSDEHGTDDGDKYNQADENKKGEDDFTDDCDDFD